MEPLKERLLPWLKKYRMAAVVLLVGILLMLLPTSKEEAASVSPSVPETQALQQELEELLSHLEGAGKVRLLLTQAQGSVTHYQVDESSSGFDTVLVTAADRSQQGLVSQVDPPVYLGAVVLCQGAGKASVRLAVVEAVSKATGLSSSKISVLKMK